MTLFLLLDQFLCNEFHPPPFSVPPHRTPRQTSIARARRFIAQDIRERFSHVICLSTSLLLGVTLPTLACSPLPSPMPPPPRPAALLPCCSLAPSFRKCLSSSDPSRSRNSMSSRTYYSRRRQGHDLQNLPLHRPPPLPRPSSERLSSSWAPQISP